MAAFMIFSIFNSFCRHIFLLYSLGLRGLLTLLAADNLALVADTLAFVRLRLFQCADVCGKLTDIFFVKTVDSKSTFVCLNGKTFRDFYFYRMRKAKREVKGFALYIPLVANAFNQEFFRKAFGNTLEHIAHMRCVGAHERLSLFRLAFFRNLYTLFSNFDRNEAVRRLNQRALRAFDAHLLTRDSNLG